MHSGLGQAKRNGLKVKVAQSAGPTSQVRKVAACRVEVSQTAAIENSQKVVMTASAQLASLPSKTDRYQDHGGRNRERREQSELRKGIYDCALLHAEVEATLPSTHVVFAFSPEWNLGQRHVMDWCFRRVGAIRHSQCCNADNVNRTTTPITWLTHVKPPCATPSLLRIRVQWANSNDWPGTAVAQPS
ncbi:hypothetical protein CERZMDRAFT_86337 [Cercospora zeae-maydis SCOH1-5]|uniref:Uncharacterized protein n=1 Tax=Cercospora zeae-maydis SCOH1-5 TaxID=717836 RepID=A0A6A6FA57_9PEZI|nr:hypothetical protein CERZMDRAFT_86337 [Cercospora zeae-maydis SCOH1-5]